jgi:hypothetical protein
MVYKILGFGLDVGQLSRTSRRDSELIPSASVSTSVTSDLAYIGCHFTLNLPIISQHSVSNIGITPLLCVRF